MSEVKVAEGYKQTEVGVIPKDWDLLPAKEMTSFIGGYSFSSNSAQNNGIRWVKIANVGVNKVKWDAKSYLPYSFAEMHSKYLLKENDVVIALTRPILSESLKIARLSLSDTPSLLNQRVAKLEVTSKGDTNFAYYVLQTSSFVAAMNLAMAGTDPPNIGTKALSKIQVLIPPKQEQTAIATALSDVDELIQSLEKLIAKKEAIKTGTMQQLLTGKTRLPEFATREDGSAKGFKQTELGRIPEDWDVVNLGNIGNCVIGLTYSPNDVSKFGTLVLRSSNVQNGQLAYKDNVYVDMSLPERVIVKEGDILICVRNGSRRLIGKCALIDKNSEGHAFGAFMSVFRTKLYPFIFYQFQSNLIQNQIQENMGATINQITNKDLKSFTVMLPENIREQTAIATVLSDIDTEIQALQQRLDKTRDIKQGMMQQLLTGKVRLAH